MLLQCSVFLCGLAGLGFGPAKALFIFRAKGLQCRTHIVRLIAAKARLARRIAEYGLLISLAPQVNGLSFTDEERAESLRARNRAIAALGLGSLVMAGKEGSSTLREVAFSLELGHPVLLWHSIVEEGEPWAIRLLENPLLDSQGRPLVQTVSSAADVEEALSPWSTVWWL